MDAVAVQKEAINLPGQLSPEQTSGPSKAPAPADAPRSASDGPRVPELSKKDALPQGPERRRSGRQRQQRDIYIPELPQSGAARRAQDDKTDAKGTKGSRGPKKARGAKGRGPGGRIAKKIVKLRYSNRQPCPTFGPVEIGDSHELFWLRVTLREFLLRFDKLCRLPTRHSATLNDPLQPWNDYLYKAVIVALFRLVENDNVPIFTQARQFLAEIEKSPADSPALWDTLAEFLAQCDPYASRADDLHGEAYRLELLRRLMVLTTGTHTIRLTVSNDLEQLQQLQKEFTENVKRYQTQWEDTQAKLENLRATDSEAYETKLASAERSTEDKIFRAEQTIFQQVRKYNLRTSPLGTDNWGNVYWALQQKSKDIPAWGTWILCEMRYPIHGKPVVEQSDSMVANMFRAWQQLEVKQPKKKAPKQEGLKSKINIKLTMKDAGQDTAMADAPELPAQSTTSLEPETEPKQKLERDPVLNGDHTLPQTAQQLIQQTSGQPVPAQTAGEPVAAQTAGEPVAPQTTGQPVVATGSQVQEILSPKKLADPTGEPGHDAQQTTQQPISTQKPVKQAQQFLTPANGAGVTHNSDEVTRADSVSKDGLVTESSPAQRNAPPTLTACPEVNGANVEQVAPTTQGQAELAKKLPGSEQTVPNSTHESPSKSKGRKAGDGTDKPTTKRTKKRKPFKFVEDNAVLHTVAGRENLMALAAWIKGQVGAPQNALADEIESLAYYCYD